ncbi:MAG: hypothetical protein KIT73_01310 [Burkholderiales bacterium]|nr:hypothetical protein [Burkholderiales bacterium]
MAAVRIPQYDQRTGVTTNLPAPRASGVEVLDPISLARGDIDRARDTLTRYGQSHEETQFAIETLQIRERQDADRTEVLRLAADVGIIMRDTVDSVATSTDLVGFDFAAAASDAVDEQIERQAETLKDNPAKQKWFVRAIEPARQSMLVQVRNMGQARTTAQALTEYDNGINASAKLAQANPANGAEQLAVWRASVMKDSRLDPVQKQKVIDDARRLIVNGAVLSGIERQKIGEARLRGALDNLAQGKPSGLDLPLELGTAQEQFQWLSAAAQIDGQRKSEAGAILRSDRANAETTALATGQGGTIPLSRFEEAYGPEMAVREHQRHVHTMGVYRNIKTLGGLSPEQQIRAIEGWAPKVGSKTYADDARLQEQAVAAVRELNRRRDADPVAYARENSDPVKRAAAALNEAAQTNDDAKIAAAATAYGNILLTEQQRLGVMAPVLTSPRERDEMRAAFNLPPAKPGESPDMTAADIVAQAERRYGAHWPRARAEFIQDKALPPAAIVISSLPANRPQARQQVGRMARTPLDDLKARVPKDDWKALQEGVIEEIHVFGSTYLPTAENGDIAPAFGDTMLRLAADNVITAKMSPKQAIRAARDALFGQWEMRERMRIPVEQKPDEVLRGIRTTTRNMQLLGIDVPTDLVGSRPAEEARRLWEGSVREGAVWMTNADESGAALFVRDAAGYVRPVTKGGVQVEQTWDQLRGATDPRGDSPMRSFRAPTRSMPPATPAVPPMVVDAAAPPATGSSVPATVTPEVPPRRDVKDRGNGVTEFRRMADDSALYRQFKGGRTGYFRRDKDGLYWVDVNEGLEVQNLMPVENETIALDYLLRGLDPPPPSKKRKK